MSEFKNDESGIEALRIAAMNACVDIYMDVHVSELRKSPEHLKQAWSVGQEAYAMRQKGEISHPSLNERYPDVQDIKDEAVKYRRMTRLKGKS